MTENAPLTGPSSPGAHVIDLSTAAIDNSAEKIQLAERWLNGQVVQDTSVTEAIDRAIQNDDPVPAEFKQTEPVPADIASEVALQTQKRLGLWGRYDLFYDEVGDLRNIRSEAIRTADKLDFGVVAFTTLGEWPIRVLLNAMHDKFKYVPAEQIREYLGDGPNYEYKALYIRDIIADHAPELLTPDLRVLMDPKQPAWRVASSHAAILFRNRHLGSIGSYEAEVLPDALPVGLRSKYIAEDDATMRPIDAMGDDELTQYVSNDAIARIRERGTALFSELNVTAQETFLTRRFFEIASKSNDPATKQQASERNANLGPESVLQQGDLVHATYSPPILEDILDSGIRCGESVVDNARAQINYPFTVSFLEMNEKYAAPETIPERLDNLNNAPYGPINLVFQRDEKSTDYGHEQRMRNGIQAQIFGGLPSSELKSIVIREPENKLKLVADVITKIVKHGMFIPVYDGTTGELLLSAEQFAKQRHNHASLGKFAVEK